MYIELGKSGPQGEFIPIHGAHTWIDGRVNYTTKTLDDLATIFCKAYDYPADRYRLVRNNPAAHVVKASIRKI